MDHQQVKDLLFIFLGVLSYAFGYTAFVLPEKVVMGGVSGLSALIYYATGFPPGYSIWLLNFLMLGIAIKHCRARLSTEPVSALRCWHL